MSGEHPRYGELGLQQLPRAAPRGERECAVIDRLLAGARAGAGGAQVVRGDTGIGTAALLEYARRQAGRSEREQAHATGLWSTVVLWA